MIKRMTWEDHDFIDAIASETKWNKVKVFLLQAGKDLTIETINHGAKQLFGFWVKRIKVPVAKNPVANTSVCDVKQL